jgi:hypothetical protein
VRASTTTTSAAAAAAADLHLPQPDGIITRHTAPAHFAPGWHMGCEPSTAGHHDAEGLVFPMG